jgi:hypothetical protein
VDKSSSPIKEIKIETQTVIGKFSKNTPYKTKPISRNLRKTVEMSPRKADALSMYK